MNEPTILAAKIAVLERFFAASNFTMPKSYRAILGHPERLPDYYCDVFTDPSRIISLNLTLRTNGWFRSQGWPDAFLAIGTDPESNTLYFDTTTGSDQVWMADHEVSASDRKPSKCMGMEKQADSFSEFIALCWQRYLEEEGELSSEAQDRSKEFDMLREHPNPLLLENYFEESAARYEAFASWHCTMGDFYLFFMLVNLPPKAARQLLTAAADIASRQKTYGRFRAAIILLHRLLEKSGRSQLPPSCSTAAKTILDTAKKLKLADCRGWPSVREALEKT